MTPSNADHSSSSRVSAPNQSASFLGCLDFRCDGSAPVGEISPRGDGDGDGDDAAVAPGSVLGIDDCFEENWEYVWSTYKQTTAQSSTLDVGYLSRHTLTADSTSARAAVARVGACATTCTTSSLLNTSQICTSPR